MKCSFCRNESVYFRKNEGHYYCKNHFIKNIEKRVKKEIRINQLIENGDIVAIAYSGGKDSANVLFMLNKIFGKNPKVNFFAITIDEGIKGYRDKFIKKIRVFSKKIGIKNYVFNFKEEFGVTFEKIKADNCDNCKLLKEYLLNKKARELGATKLAIGRNLNDECESIITNLLSGNLFGLVKIGNISKNSSHPKLITKIKPLILIPEKESVVYSKLNNIPSLTKKCPYHVDHNLQNEARIFLNNLENSSIGLGYSLYENSLKIANFLKSNLKDEKIGTYKRCGEPSEKDLCKVFELLEKF
jgi:uncharacterized protein (TIGR00269 family)